MLVAAFLVACGGPTELTTVGDRGITFARPDAWEQIEDLPDEGLLGRQGWVGPGVGPARRALFVDVFCADDVATVGDALVAQGRQRRDSFTVRRRRALDVPGAEQATLIASRYRQTTGGPASPAAGATPPPTPRTATPGPAGAVTLTRVDVLAQARGVTVRLGLTGPVDPEDDLVDRIVSSLEIDPGGLQPLVNSCGGPGATGAPTPRPAPTG